MNRRRRMWKFLLTTTRVLVALAVLDMLVALGLLAAVGVLGEKIE